MKKTFVTIYLIFVSLLSVYLLIVIREKNFIIEEKEYETLECSAMIDSLLTEQEYFITTLKENK